jgi:hypothetical protein
LAHVEQSVDTRRPCEEVFAYVTARDRWRERARLVIGLAHVSPAPRRGGAILTVVDRFLGRTTETDYTVTACEPPPRPVARSTSGPVAGGFAFARAPIAEGTRLTEAWGFGPRNVLKLAAPPVAASVERRLTESQASLKGRLEAL